MDNPSERQSVRKNFRFTPEFWERVGAFRWEHRIAKESDAVRILIERGLELDEQSKS